MIRPTSMMLFATGVAAALALVLTTIEANSSIPQPDGGWKVKTSTPINGTVSDCTSAVDFASRIHAQGIGIGDDTQRKQMQQAVLGILLIAKDVPTNNPHLPRHLDMLVSVANYTFSFGGTEPQLRAGVMNMCREVRS